MKVRADVLVKDNRAEIRFSDTPAAGVRQWLKHDWGFRYNGTSWTRDDVNWGVFLDEVKRFSGVEWAFYFVRADGSLQPAVVDEAPGVRRPKLIPAPAASTDAQGGVGRGDTAAPAPVKLRTIRAFRCLQCGRLRPLDEGDAEELARRERAALERALAQNGAACWPAPENVTVVGVILCEDGKEG
jgi:hypothetical protein